MRNLLNEPAFDEWQAERFGLVKEYLGAILVYDQLVKKAEAMRRVVVYSPSRELYELSKAAERLTHKLAEETQLLKSIIAKYGHK